MSSDRNTSYQPKVFGAAELKRGLEAITHEVFGQGGTFRVSTFESLPDGTRHALHDQPPEALLKLCDLREQRTSLSIKFGTMVPKFDMLRESATIDVRADTEGYLDFEYSARDLETLERMVALTEGTLGLTGAPSSSSRAYERGRKAAEAGPRPAIWDALEELEERISKLERVARQQHDLTCFVSFQFSGVSLRYAAEVKAFLQLLDVSVLTGEGYEPKPIVEKVRGRLSEPIDVLVVIEVAERKSSWTRDEVAKAQQPGVLLIPLVEEGGHFDSGIYGDHEYIQFSPGHVGDAFHKLLEGIRYARRLKPQQD